MSIFDRLSGFLTGKGKPNGKANTGNEQALLVYISFSDDEHGESEEREDLFKLEDELIEAIDNAQAGEFDGNEIGGGYFTLFMYGPSAEALWEVAAPVLKRFPMPAGSYAVKQFGPPGSAEERVDF